MLIVYRLRMRVLTNCSAIPTTRRRHYLVGALPVEVAEGKPQMMTLTRESEFTAVHSQQVLPSWHECHYRHGHDWTVRTEVVANDNLTDDESVAVHTALAECDT
ncbi:hypothetical protein ACIHIX_18485 [Streptomyces sp. NPDC051913]|uniref:hypothetical protein n=1 Tax=Streptomyces sp. NPDC051913 TaxID=3365676 RepID=UPI0037D54DA0